MTKLPVIPKGHCYLMVLVLQKEESTFAEAVFDQDGCFRWGYDEVVIEDVEAWLPLPTRAVLAQEAGRQEPVAWMDPRIGPDGFDQEQPAVTWRSPDEQKFFHQQMGGPEKYRMCTIPLYAAPVSVVLPERMRQNCNGQLADFRTYEEARGGNACLEKVKELNQ